MLLHDVHVCSSQLVPDEQAVLVQPFLGDGQQTDGIMYIIRVD